MLKAEIITIGDELLIGQVVDTNSAFMAKRLNEWGIAVYQITSVHDNREHILEALQAAEKRVDLVLLTGGLGPTKDDITKKVLADYFDTRLVYRQDIHEHLLRWYAERPQVLNRLTETQCEFPEAADLISNPVGSAQVMAFRKILSTSETEGRDVIFISMPGVPREMEHVMQNGVREYLYANYPSLGRDGIITHRNVEVAGIPESSLAIELEDFESSLPDSIHLAYLPHPDRRSITLRLSGYECPVSLVEEKEFQLRTLCKPYLA